MRAPLETLRREDGVTIVELLVVCLIGIVVLSAAAGLTESSGRASSRVSDEVEVAQRARLAMEQVTRELRSQVCLDTAVPTRPWLPPIVDGRDSEITFYNEIDGNPDFKPERQRIYYSAAAGGSIVQQSTTTTSTGPPWSFLGPATSRVLLTNVGQLTSQPIFRYYTFDSTTALTTPLDTTLATPLVANSTARVVRVDVAFETLPTSGNTEPSRRSGLSSSVYLRNTDHSDGDPSAPRSWGPRCD